jgi:parvulin-like peptidyl-prolyl isomerase
MRKRFAIHLRYILYVIIAIFVVTLPLVFAPNLGNQQQEQPQKQSVDQEIIAKVDGTPMTRGELERQFDRSSAQMLLFLEQIGQAPGVDRLWQDRLNAFDEAVTRHLLLEEAKRQGISASDRDVWNSAGKQAQQQLDQIKQQAKGQKLDQVLAQIVSRAERESRTSVSERSFRKWLARRLHDDHGVDLREDLILERLRQRVVGRVTASEQDLLNSYDQVTLRVIIVSTTPLVPGKPARTDEQARKRAEELMAKARAGADFAELAKTDSDDPSAKSTGGLQPPATLSRLPREWQQAIASLKVGETSDPAKTGGGYALLKLEKRERQLPADFQKKKEALLRQYIEQQQSQTWDSYGKQLRQKAKVQVGDPELLAYQALSKGNYNEALPLLQKASETADSLRGLAAGSIYYQLGAALSLKNQWKDAEKAYERASDSLGSDESAPPSARAQALLEMARAYENLKDYKNAAIWYQAAGDQSTNPTVHQQLLLAYQKIGRKDLADQEQQWLANYQKQEEERRKAYEAQQKAAEEAAKKQPAKPAGAGPAPAPGGAPRSAPPAPSRGQRAPAGSARAGRAPATTPAAPLPGP